MVFSARVQPEPFGGIAEGLVDRPLQEVFPQALADEFRHEAELHQFDLVGNATVQLGETGGHPLDEEHMHLFPRILNEPCQVGVGMLSTTRPVPIAADGIVQEPVVRDRGIPGMNHSETRLWRGHRPPVVGEHFEVRGGDGHAVLLLIESNLSRYQSWPRSTSLGTVRLR
jgi:hypothetical protein